MQPAKIRVLHVVLSMETGGLENGIVNLVNHSDKERFEVDILCLRHRGELADRISNPNSKVIFDDKAGEGIWASIKKIVQTCKLGNYHIVHSHGFTTMLTSYIAKLISPYPMIINGEHGTLYHDSLKQRLIQKFLFMKMDLNLSVSQDLKETIISAFSIHKDNFHTIINGVDTDKFSNTGDLSSIFRQSLDIKDDDLIIGSVGRLVPVKNYPSLINAFSMLLKSHPDCHLVLAGDGVERELLKSHIDELGLQDKIHLLGRRDDIPSLMNQFDLFVLPSFSEGLSNTLLEAMSCGTPVIASDVGGNKEIILEGTTGYLYPSDDATSLANILKSLASNQALIKQLSDNARKHICHRFSIESMVRNYEDTYLNLIANQTECNSKQEVID